VRVLVVHASTRGGTAGLARMVAESLANHGANVDVGEARDVDDLDGYDAVIVGGALYNGKWHPDASWFVQRNLPALRATNVWFFSSGPLDDSARSGSLAPVPQVQELARRADVRGHMTFGGVLERRTGKFFGSLLSWGKPGDFRDPQHVAEWVELLAARIAEPRSITLPDVEPESPGVAHRMLRRLVDAGEDPYDGSEDLGLDVFADTAEP
jgi:menaquinone-dependent protoporphyrinogen oxidase